MIYVLPDPAMLGLDQNPPLAGFRRYLWTTLVMILHK